MNYGLLQKATKEAEIRHGRSAFLSSLCSLLFKNAPFLPNHPFEQVMCDLLHAFVRALLGDPMPCGVLMPGRTGQAIGPPDRGCIEHHVALGAVVERRGIMPHRSSIDRGVSLRDDIHSREVHGRGAMPFPAQ